ncbi:unnamed protein product [Gadus morhua 'NCC']
MSGVIHDHLNTPLRRPRPGPGGPLSLTAGNRAGVQAPCSPTSPWMSGRNPRADYRLVCVSLRQLAGLSARPPTRPPHPAAHSSTRAVVCRPAAASSQLAHCFAFAEPTSISSGEFSVHIEEERNSRAENDRRHTPLR